MSTQVTANPFFSPTQISGCQLWLDAADVNGNRTNPANGASVSTWVDKSGSGFNATVASGKVAGIYSTANNAMNFASSNTGYVTSYTANPTNETMFVVTNNSTLNVNNFIIIGGQSGARSLSVASTGNGLGSVGNLKNQIAFLASTPGGTYTAGTTVMVTSQFTSSSNSISLNGGTTISGGAPGFTAGTTTYLGVDTTTSAYYYIGLAMEIIFYNSILNTTQRQQVEGYLAWKWGLQANLPSTHPYKNSLIPPLLNPPTTLPAMLQNPTATFLLTQISGCRLWLDGADSTTITTVTGVSQWNDKSGNAYNLTQGSTGSQPTRTGNLLNFVSNYYLNIPQAAINNLSTWSLFFVINPISSSNWIMAKQRDGVNTYNVLSMTYNTNNGGNPQTGSTGFLYWRSLNNAGQLVSTGAISTSTLQIWNLTYDGTNLYLYINGALEKTTAGSFAISNDTSATNFTLGVWIQASTIINSGVTNFRLGEMLVYTTGLATSQRQQIEGYLAWKWGLQANLPTNHPYKSGPPYSAIFTAPSRSLGIAATWNPTLITGCQLWLDAADVNGNRTNPLNGASVSTWTDKSGIGNNAVGTVAPTYDSVARYVLFNGSTQYFTLPNGTYPFGNTPYSIFIVAYTRNAGNPQWVIYGGSESQNQAIGLLFYTTNAIWHSWWVNEYRVDNSITNNVPSIVNISYATTRSIIVNGGTASVNNPGSIRSSTNNPNYIGRRPGAQFFDGGMAECIVFNSEIPTSQRQQVEGYLAWKWGLVASLPANHPFKRWPPPP